MTGSEAPTPDVVIGRYGLRTFRVSADGYLLPATDTPRGLDDTWREGTCIAACGLGHDHQPPQIDCTCGLYSLDCLADLREQYPTAAYLVAVVALEGRVIEGDRGTRAEAARVVGFWLDRTALAYDMVVDLEHRYREIPFWDSVDELITSFRGLKVGELLAEKMPKESKAQRPRRPKSPKPPLWPFVGYGVARLVGLVFVVAVLLILPSIVWFWRGEPPVVTGDFRVGAVGFEPTIYAAGQISIVVAIETWWFVSLYALFVAVLSWHRRMNYPDRVQSHTLVAAWIAQTIVVAVEAGYLPIELVVVVIWVSVDYLAVTPLVQRRRSRSSGARPIASVGFPAGGLRRAPDPRVVRVQRYLDSPSDDAYPG